MNLLASTVKKNGLEELQIEAKEIIGDESSPHGLVSTYLVTLSNFIYFRYTEW